MSGPTFQELLVSGPRGDCLVDVRLTARELAAVIMAVSPSFGGDGVARAAASANEAGLAPQYLVAFKSALARLGMGLARVTPGAGEHVDEFAVLLASTDQERSALDTPPRGEFVD